jgi:hypothetical protein
MCPAFGGSNAGGQTMVIGVVLSSVISSLAGLVFAMVFAGTVPVMLASYLLWGMTGALGFICLSVQALERDI